MKKLVLLLLPLISLISKAKTIDHKVQGDETAWSIASLYFGDGNRYADLLKLNGLKSPKDMKNGLVLKIENPKYEPSQKDFQTRVEKLKQAKAARPNKKFSSIEKETKVVLPDPKIRLASPTTLPFSVVTDPHKSTRQKAKEEVGEKTSSNTTE